MNDRETGNDTARWIAVAGDALHWESWGEQHAVFDIRSGETHLLPATTKALLQELSGTPCRTQDLARSLSMRTQLNCDARYIQHVADLLRQLLALGLVEKTES